MGNIDRREERNFGRKPIQDANDGCQERLFGLGDLGPVLMALDLDGIWSVDRARSRSPSAIAEAR